MNYDLKQEVKLFMVFDILGDVVRTGPQLWHVSRERLEDVKNHVFDLMSITRILKKICLRILITIKFLIIFYVMIYQKL